MQGQALPGHGLAEVVDAARDIDLAGHAGVRNVPGQPGAQPHVHDPADARAVVPLPFLSRAIELMEVHGQLRLAPHQAPARTRLCRLW